MRCTFKLFYDDEDREPVSFTIRTPDFLAWEEEFDRNYITLLEDTTLRDRCWFAHRALAPDVPYAEFVETIGSIVVMGEPEDPVPLESGPPTST